MTDSKIRKARTKDLPELQGIARRTIDKCYRSFLGDEEVDRFISSGDSDKEIENHPSNCDVLLQDGRILAFTIYFDNLIHLMMVDVSFHRCGIGSELLQHCERRLFALGSKAISLETFECNQQAISFYLKHGWAVAGRQQDQDHGFIRVIFEKFA